jgi:hypothetical protein
MQYTTIVMKVGTAMKLYAYISEKNELGWPSQYGDWAAG